MRVHRLMQIGAGGIGQHFAPVAAKILKYKQGYVPFHVFEGDKHESSNESRQRGSVGMNKAVFLKHHMGVDCVPEAYFIEDEDHFAQLLANRGSEEVPQVVAICVDNDATRHFIYEGIKQTRQPCVVIDMANEEHHGDVVRVVWTGTGWLPSDPLDLYPQLKRPGDRPPQAYCQTKAPSAPQLITTNMQAAVIGARMLLNFMNDEPDASQVTFDHSSWKMRNPDA